MPDNRTCLICDGGPGNECACSCPEGPTYQISGRPEQPRPVASPQEFIADWNRMVATVAEFSAKWDLPKPEMIFHPQVHTVMNAVADVRILGTLIHMGVKVRFGRFEQATVLREF